MGFLIVFFGGGIGAAARHGVNLIAAHLVGTAFPFGTLFINVTGSLLIGIVAEWLALPGAIPQHWRLFIMTGILGGYTTFSAFSLETALLYERGQAVAAAAYVLASVVLAVAGLFGGLWIMRVAS